MDGQETAKSVVWTAIWTAGLIRACRVPIPAVEKTTAPTLRIQVRRMQTETEWEMCVTRMQTGMELLMGL